MSGKKYYLHLQMLFTWFKKAVRNNIIQVNIKSKNNRFILLPIYTQSPSVKLHIKYPNSYDTHPPVIKKVIHEPHPLN